ncbi:hypothetical protein L873DRAFT_1780897 [Choiromyces venosus 120613-1]|uniref:Uncharacterized protein n=1 Tax=Choiromyces venosus 120613-1 TaxID=1336337 RepID=A0A3N4J593_9PEZI|nr:hypothetical protein L873DRAFT_1780897 [Choiromyces venosus 120613-1]
MKTTLVSTVLALFTAAFIPTTAAPTPGVASFKLKADSTAPAGLAGRIVTWDGTLDGNLGFSKSAEEFSAFIQFNATEGIAFYAHNTALRIYLRPTHGTPAYFAKLGNPLNDAVPALTLSTNFTIGAWAVEPGEVHYIFGYNENYGVWSACGGPDEYTLYYGVVTAPRAGCTANFGLDLFYE